MTMRRTSLRPEYSVILTFAMLTIIGTGALELPFVTHVDGLTFPDALFTATSAVCVTGLIVVDTSGFNTWGQGIIIALIQLGGLGIMTATSFLILLLRGELNLQQRIVTARITGTETLRDVNGLLTVILVFTLISEAAGFILMLPGFLSMGYDPAAAAFHALFHTVSAFNNAGFSTFDTSLVNVPGIIQAAVALLVVLGGLGYPVIHAVMLRTRGHRLRLHAKMVLMATAILIPLGAVLIFVAETGGVSVWDALFQSVTARTAGFNTLNIAGLHPASLFILMVFMVIGASPGSTGGGVKTTTIMVAGASIMRILGGFERVVVFRRKLNVLDILRAYALIMLYGLTIVTATAVILVVQGSDFLPTLFEVTSAIGTVGLSMGLTPELGLTGKLVIIITMFLGRVGPASLIFLLFSKGPASRIDYPEETILLG